MAASKTQTTGTRHFDNATGTQTYSTGVNFVAGRLIIFTAVTYDTELTSVTVGGTALTRAAHNTAAGTDFPSIWYGIATGTPTDVVSVVVGGGGNYVSYCVDEWSGMAASSPLDVVVQTGNGTSTSPSIASGTLGQADELVYAVFYAQTNNDGITKPTGWTDGFNEPDGNSHEPGASAYKVVSSASTVTATWTLATSYAWVACLATFKIAAGGSTYTLTMGQGSLSLSGQALAMHHGYRLDLQAATSPVQSDTTGPRLLKGSRLTAAQGSITLSGQAMTPKATRLLALVLGTFSIAGQNVTLRKGFAALLAQGTYSIAGQAALFHHGFYLLLTQGALSLAGQAVAFLRGLRLALGQASVSLAGQALGMFRGFRATLAQASFSLTGQVLAMLHAAKLVLGLGSTSISGQSVTLTFAPSGGHSLLLSSGLLSLAGQPLNFRLAARLAASQGAVTTAGQAVVFLRGVRISLGQGALAATGQSVGFKRGLQLPLALGVYSLSGQNVVLQTAGRLPLNAGSFSVAGQALGLRRGFPLQLAAGAFITVGFSVAFTSTRKLPASLGVFVLAGGDVALRHSAGTVLLAETGLVALTGFDVLISQGAPSAAGMQRAFEAWQRSLGKNWRKPG